MTPDPNREYHLSKRDPKRWAQMPDVERAAYDAGWLDCAALTARHFELRRAVEGEFRASCILCGGHGLVLARPRLADPDAPMVNCPDCGGSGRRVS